MSQEEVCQIPVALPQRPEQRRAAFLISRIDVGSAKDKQLRHLLGSGGYQALIHGPMQRRKALSVLHLHAGPSVEQNLDDFPLATVCSAVQGGPSP